MAETKEVLPFQVGDVLITESGEGAPYRSKVFSLDSIEWQEQRAYWRVNSNEGFSTTASSCRKATVEEINREFLYQVDLIGVAEDRLMELAQMKEKVEKETP